MAKPTFVAERLKALGDHPDAAYAFPQCSSSAGGGHQPIPTLQCAPLPSAHPIVSVFRHQAFTAVRFDQGLRAGLEDWDLFHSLVEHGAKGPLVDRPLVHYRTDESGESLTTASEHLLTSCLGLYLRLMLRHLPSFHPGGLDPVFEPLRPGVPGRDQALGATPGASGLPPRLEAARRRAPLRM